MNKVEVKEVKKKVRIQGSIVSREILIDGNRLLPDKSQKIRNHSPDGFSWGYGGSGPAQLALAILLKFHSQEFALRYYQNFKWKFVAKLPQTDFNVEVDIYKLTEKLSREGDSV